MEEAQIRSTSITYSPTLVVAPTMMATTPTTPSTSPTMPTTHCPYSCYKGWQIDNVDLLGAIDQVAWPLLALIICHVAIMITAKNDATITAITVMISHQEAQGPHNFVAIDQTSVQR
jgi:hypothetical protein